MANKEAALARLAELNKQAYQQVLRALFAKNKSNAVSHLAHCPPRPIIFPMHSEDPTSAAFHLHRSSMYSACPCFWTFMHPGYLTAHSTTVLCRSGDDEAHAQAEEGAKYNF